MKKRLMALANAGMATIALVCAMVAAPLSTAFATPTGNNGTLKVHEIGTPTGKEDEDPKVCQFNFEGFGFDPSQSGYILIKTQGGSQPVGQNAGPFSFGPTNGSGYAISQDFNTPGGATIVNGTYKATLYGKDMGGYINLQDDKAKSKVFKVNCAPVPTPVTPPEVTFYDACGTVNDTYTIPSTLGVVYSVGGSAQAANTYPGTGTVAVTATAQAGYTLQGTTSWQHTFTDVACPLPHVTADTPTMLDLECDVDGYFTIPSTDGVIYKVDNIVTKEGSYPVSAPKTIVITAEAAQGYVLDGKNSWTFKFHAPKHCDCEETPPEDLCPNIDDIQTKVPDGMELDNQGNCVTPGRGGVDETPTPPTPPTAPVPVVLTASQSTAPAQTELTDTGASTLQATLVAASLIAVALGVVILGNRKVSRS